MNLQPRSNNIGEILVKEISFEIYTRGSLGSFYTEFYTRKQETCREVWERFRGIDGLREFLLVL